ncbi:MAG: restriction endonuclease [Saprospiraceae bacterium]|nr:restriction endonuclease [Saprospiraceae bacterium]
MPIIDFREIPQANTGNGDQDTFELFARDFLEAMGFIIIQQPFRGADGKKDLIVDELRIGNEGKTVIRWLVSAKHNAHSSKARAVNDADEPDILDRVVSNHCHGFMGIYSTLPSTTLHNKLEKYKSSGKIEVTTYDRERLENAIISNLDAQRESLFLRYFSVSYQKYKELKGGDRMPFEEQASPCIISDEQVFQACKDAIIVLEIEKLKFKYSKLEWKDGEEVLNEFHQFAEHSNHRISYEVLLFLSYLADKTRGGMPSETASSIYWLVLTFYVHPTNEVEKERANELAQLCIRIAFSLIYDASIYSNNMEIAAYGYNILKFVYSKSFEIGSSKLREGVLKQFEEIERIFHQREHQDLTLAIELLNVFRDDLGSKSLALPPFSGKLYELIIDKPR